MRWRFLVFMFTVLCAAVAGLVRAEPRSEQMHRGAKLYSAHCASCHGVNGEGARDFPRPIMQPGHMLRKLKTGQGLYDFNDMLMPWDDPTKVSPEAKLDITVYMLMRMGAVKSNATLRPDDLARIQIE
jgi:mono/diheme cytochrome c family protein